MGILDQMRLLAGRLRKAPERDTDAYPRLMSLGMMGQGRRKNEALIKPTPSNLRYFSRTPYARKAINTIKNPIAMLDWEVAPKDGAAESSELARQIEIVTNCLENPNQDDSFRTLLEQVIEDLMVCGAGTLEQQIGGHGARPLWLWPVDALSIQIYPLWSGAKNEARYLQTEGFGNYLDRRAHV